MAESQRESKRIGWQNRQNQPPNIILEQKKMTQVTNLAKELKVGEAEFLEHFFKIPWEPKIDGFVINISSFLVELSWKDKFPN